MDNTKDYKEAWDAINSGLLDTSDLAPYIDTIKEALIAACFNVEYMEQERMVGKMEMACAIKVRLNLGLDKKDIEAHVNEFLKEYQEWFNNTNIKFGGKN